MSDFEYSTDALNVKQIFYGSKIVIYVEGDDDILFWNVVFSTIKNFKYRIESVNGSIVLDGYIKKIITGELHAIAARDSDYLAHSKGKENHDRILYTYGYSIENTLYTADSIHELTKLWCSDISLKSTICREWLESFNSSMQYILALDIVNDITGTGLKVIQNNCSQFMKDKNSSDLCSKMIDQKATEIFEKLPADKVATMVKFLNANATDVSILIKGHFLASAVIRFISKRKQKLKPKMNVSYDALYRTAISQFENKIKSSIDLTEHYVKSASRAAATCQYP